MVMMSTAAAVKTQGSQSLSCWVCMGADCRLPEGRDTPKPITKRSGGEEDGRDGGEPEPNLMGLTKHSARFRCLVADVVLFAAIVIICKCCLAFDENLCVSAPVAVSL